MLFFFTPSPVASRNSLRREREQNLHNSPRVINDEVRLRGSDSSDTIYRYLGLKASEIKNDKGYIKSSESHFCRDSDFFPPRFWSFSDPFSAGVLKSTSR